MRHKVIVTGAAGRTGSTIFEALLKDVDYDVIGTVHSKESREKLMKKVGCDIDAIALLDVTSIGHENQPEELIGAKSMIICTSSMPTFDFTGFVCRPFYKCFKLKGRPMFKFPDGGSPEQVDYHGQMNQIEMAKRLGVEHIVLVGSMGGTQPNHFLNSIGKDAQGGGDGGILIWKRKAEEYLIESGLSYTIIHAGGLKDYEPNYAREMIIYDIDDKLLDKYKRHRISRYTIRDLCLAGLKIGKNHNTAFDCIAVSRPKALTTSVESVEASLRSFLDQQVSCNYSKSG